MYSPSIVLCFAFLLVASFSEFQEDFTNGDEQSDNSTVQYDFFVNSTKYQNEETELTRCKSHGANHENSVKNKNQMQYESCINSTKNNCKNDSMRYESREYIIKNHEDNNQTSMEFCTNSIEIDNFTLPEINENFTKTEDKNNSISYKYDDSNRTMKTTFVKNEECKDNITCIQFCCPYGYNLTVKGQCVEHGEDTYAFPNKQKNDSGESSQISDELFLTVHDPCVAQGRGRRFVFANTYLFLTDGSLYMNTGEFISPKSYCFAILFRDVYDVIACTDQTRLPVYISACHLLSLPFLLLTFIVYSILPELRNIHGYSLRAHVGSLFITYAIIYPGQQVSGLAELKYCVALAYIFNFFFLSSFFWLNVTCFDIWWTFRELRSHRRGGNHYERKKLIIYSSYAWGVTIILNGFCAIMDNIPNLPENLIRPEICEKRFWYGENIAKSLYFYVPMSITIVSNVFFFICTTLTILHQKIHTASELRDSESKRHDENKQRYILQLRL
ncbi:PREDICTED: G-protein coupled receptor Mth2-like [Acromyrmex echinatior]|uniref:G-protein coupled receptor Mth2-like n=1 Tax=Acromyrmex echinatior TaxID=103372 RepID=UPI000580E76A|nr:PREDICTED: G-protein coupled receptor Mth2-like [Acromyrmex echinatior]